MEIELKVRKELYNVYSQMILTGVPRPFNGKIMVEDKADNHIQRMKLNSLSQNMQRQVKNKKLDKLDCKIKDLCAL